MHLHRLKDPSKSKNRCVCGVKICSSVKGGFGCTLEDDHSGPCRNDYAPEVGTWKENFSEEGGSIKRRGKG